MIVIVHPLIRKELAPILVMTIWSTSICLCNESLIAIHYLTNAEYALLVGDCSPKVFGRSHYVFTSI